LEVAAVRAGDEEFFLVAAVKGAVDGAVLQLRLAEVDLEAAGAGLLPAGAIGEDVFAVLFDFVVDVQRGLFVREFAGGK
jgi:hypothetical protein